MRPLDRLTSIKLKLGVIIVGAVAVTSVAIVVGIEAGFRWAVTAGVATIAGLFAIQVLARGMTSPLREMVSATRDMAKGDYSRRVTATSRDEVGELARAFNQMASELSEVDRLRRDLVANVSHELRTPITALRAVLENLVDGVEPADPRTLETLLTQVHRLTRLVDQLLDLSKLEAGTIPLRVSSFEVAALLDQAIRESEINAERVHELNVHFDLKVEPEDLMLRGDAERIHQVISNLIDNAIRYSPKQGRIAVRAHAESGAVVIEVADEGAGIPPAEREKVFERFYRSDSSRSSDSGGTGLGLAIARWIVDQHGGQILARENDPRGCKMLVKLPAGAS